MQLIVEEVDCAYYADVVLMKQDLERIEKGESLYGEILFKKIKCYVGVRLQGVWDYNEQEEKNTNRS
jgi:hypothetical protein